MEKLSVQNLDHLGIIAGLVDELEIVEQVNQRLGEDPRERISAGLIVKAMILNGLGFVSSPLYLFGQFFQGKATEQLLGPGISAEHLNDDRLGRVLDALYKSDLSGLFLTICLKAAEKFGLTRNSAHLDATSMSVAGAYHSSTGKKNAKSNPEPPPTDPTADPGITPIAITYGYSRDHRPDLKQFVMNLVCWNDGDIPAYLEIADGNQADKARFAGLMQTFQHQWQFEGLHIADSALYSEANIQQLSTLKWLTRVPLSITTASNLVSQLADTALHDTTLEGYRIATLCCNYGGVAQRWFVVESEQRRKSDLKALDKTLAKAEGSWSTQLQQLSRQAFACEADAWAALNAFEHSLPWHQLGQSTVVAKPHYARRGKPKQGEEPTHFTYHGQATLLLKTDVVAMHQRRAGRFILATNVLDADVLTPQEALEEYKAQQGTERGFRFLKDPLFFASSVFLKSTERIMALAMVMGLCLLVYSLGQRHLRQALLKADQSLPNQLGKATQRPTLRWVFQCFMAVHYVIINGVAQVVNLSEQRCRILQFFSASCRKYYLLA